MINKKFKDRGVEMKIKLAVLFGGQSTEHEVSRCSAQSVLSNIDSSKYEVYPIGITKEGKWFEYKGSYDKIEDGTWENDEFFKEDGYKILFNQEVDVIFPVLHGLYGEDGTIQGLCKFLNIPCVGPSVLSSALCMDKVYTKYILEQFGIDQAKFVAFNKHEYEKDSKYYINIIIEKLPYPLFIKPSNSGSSVGITKAHNEEELIFGIEEAFKYDNRVLVEEGINAREIEVSVLGNKEIQASIPGEIIPSKEFYDYEAKYKSETSKLIIPADLSEEKLEEIKNIAIKAYKTLDCEGMARVDFLVEKDTNRIYLNELNTIPGFTRISMYPKLWEKSGLPYDKLIDKLINLALDNKIEG